MATIRPDEISSIIKAKIENYSSTMEVSNVGSVLEVGDGIARVYEMQCQMSLLNSMTDSAHSVLH